MDQIKDIIPEIIKTISEHKPQKETKIQRVWENLFEGKIVKHTNIFGIKDGKLMVHVDSPVWLFRLNSQKYKILKEIKEETPEIEDIRFIIGKVKKNE